MRGVRGLTQVTKLSNLSFRSRIEKSGLLIPDPVLCHIPEFWLPQGSNRTGLYPTKSSGGRPCKDFLQTHPSP